MAYIMHLPLGTGVPEGECIYLPYSQRANVLTIQGSIQWGTEASTPKKIKLYSTHYSREGST